jgi:23S rRNA pseudouridine2605 synthase
MGIASRREIERWVEQGRIKINGKVARLGATIGSNDKVSVDGRLQTIKPLARSIPRVLVYHKPEGQICSRATDETRPSVFASLPEIAGGRWVSVGRLDLNTSGLLLFTDDGDLANKLMHPSSNIEREYAVRVHGPVHEKAIQALLEGVKVEGKSAKFDRMRETESGDGRNQWFRVVLREGRYREVRNMWKATGYEVNRLKRVRYGTVKLPRDLKIGQHKMMAPLQLSKLLGSIGMGHIATRERDLKRR